MAICNVKFSLLLKMLNELLRLYCGGWLVWHIYIFVNMY